MPVKSLPSWFDGIHVSMAGSYIALEGAWRQHNEVSNGASDPPFANPGIPLQNSALWSEREFRLSAQQSRIALKVNGDIDPNQHLKAYYEMDFLGASTDANNRESNSFTPRIRQAYAQYDNDVYHLHAVAGQAWSLLTKNYYGMLPGTENALVTINAQYVPGFDWLRNPQVRFVYDWDKIAWFGLSIEQPATVFPGGVSAGTVSPPAPIITSINNTCTGASHLNGTTTCSNDIAPDIIEKAAFDPGWGHYEIFGLQRFFTDHTLTCIAGACVAGSTAMTGPTTTKTNFGAGVGGSVLLPLIPKYLEFTGSFLYGRGISRYGAAQLADVTIAADGSLTPLTGLSALVGLIGHPWDGLDVYAYAGMEQVSASFFNVGTTLFGFGNPGFSNVGCTIVTPFSFAGGIPANCIGNNRRVSDVTVGFWQNVYKGNYGRVAVGAQYAYIKREVFEGIGGAPSTDDNIILTSIRYYPF